VIAARDYKLGVGKARGNPAESLDHQFQFFVCAPLSEREDAVLGIASPGEVRILGAVRENAVSAHVHIVAAIAFIEDLPVTRHENRYRVGRQQHSCCDGSGEAVGPGKTNAEIFQIHSVHQVMEGNVRVASCEAREKRRTQAGESMKRIATECAEEQVEPDDLGIQFAQFAEQTNCAAGAVRRPAALDGIALEFGSSGGNFVGQYGQPYKGISLKFLGDMKSIFAQTSMTGWKRCDQTDSHSASPGRLSLDERAKANVGIIQNSR
jgi:hypothetical protein